MSSVWSPLVINVTVLPLLILLSPHGRDTGVPYLTSRSEGCVSLITLGKTKWGITTNKSATTHQKRDVQQSLVECWASVSDGGPILKQPLVFAGECNNTHWEIVSILPLQRYPSVIQLAHFIAILTDGNIYYRPGSTRETLSQSFVHIKKTIKCLALIICPCDLKDWVAQVSYSTP